MDIFLFYKNRINEFSKLENSCKSKEKKFPIIRLSTIILGFISFYSFYNYSVLFSWISLLVFIVIFIIISRIDFKNSSKLSLYKLHKSLNEQEINCLNGSAKFYYDGKDYIDNNHLYSSDLDVFGENSIFQYINRTSFKISSDILATWLKYPSSVNELKLRQEAVEELRDKIDWRQLLYAFGIKSKASRKNPERLLKWIKEPFEIKNISRIFIICICLSSITITSLILTKLFIPIIIPITLIIVQYLITLKTNRKIAIIHEKVSKTADLLEAYSDIINLIEKEQFNSSKLKILAQAINSKNKSNASIVKQLSKIVNTFDFKFNIVIHPIINILFFFDIIQVFRLYRWKRKNYYNIEKLFFNIGEFEVLSSFANLSFNNPNWVFPEITSEHFKLNAKNLGHPLINQRERICNNFEIDADSKIIIITGSNMSGKSTFLRTIGVNIVLAMAGSCVCAEKFILSPVKVLTSMRVFDSLEENTSTFYAELKRIKTIVEIVEQKEKVFLLLDEILKGTNSNDRHLGSVALIKQLIKNNATGIIATHDISLSQLSSDLPNNLENFNFNVQVEKDELFFDYKLNNGICKSLNASILMRKMGINI